MTLQPLLAYLPWHARESALRALAPVFVFAVLTGLPLWGMTTGTEGFDLATNPQAQAFASQLFQGNAGLTILIGGLLLMNRTIGLDRERQHVRLLFAHPVAPEAFYLQRYLVGLVLLVAIFASVPLVYSWLAVPVPVFGTIRATLLVGALVGALGVLLSAITQRDGIPLLALLLITTTLHELRKTDVLPDWADALTFALPPIGFAVDYAGAWLRGEAGPAGNGLVLVIGYTVGLLAAGLWVVRRAPLVR